jgi:hypothetical protein
MKTIVTIAREAALEVLLALQVAIDHVTNLGWVVDQIRFEDAFALMLDALFPTMPYGHPGRNP